MKTGTIKILLIILALCSLSSCALEIKYQAPRWKYSLKYNGKEESFSCLEDTYPVSMEYSVPEFFIKEDGTVIFRFFYKEMGFKLQAANDGPFKNGRKYEFRKGDEFFDVSFDWLYKGKDYECTSGWMEFKRGFLSDAAYTVSFEFDLTAPDGSKMEIRDGVFSACNKVQPRNTAQGIQ